MSECEAKVPALRFKGYLGPWEKKRLGEIFSERQTRSVHGELLSVSMNSGVFPASQNGRYDNSSIENGNYKCVAKGDMAYNSMRMWQGACGASAYDGLVSPAYTVASPHEDADSVFFEYSFKRDEMLFVFRQHSQGLTSDTWNLKFPLFSQIPIHSPALSEQQQIGSLFRSLDALIAGREKALEKLEALKKSMLLKMFPQGDATVPEVRFKGFAGEWEKSSFDEMFIHIPSKAFQIQSTDYRESGQFPVVDQGKVRIVGYTDNVGKVFKAKDNPVIVFGDHTREVKFVDFDFVVGADGTQLLRSPKNDIQFMSYVVQSTPLPNMGYSRHFKFLQEATFLAPTLPEQHKIGAFFRSLDALIAARREEIGKLKQMKKALLERMFV